MSKKSTQVQSQTTPTSKTSTKKKINNKMDKVNNESNTNGNTQEDDETCKSLFTKMLLRIESLEQKVEKLEGSLETSHQVNKVLRGEVDRLNEELDNNEQYSRRTCIVVSGIETDLHESPDSLYQKIKNLTSNHLKEDSVHPNAFDMEFDKCHRIGTPKNGRQSVIVKFRSDSFRERMYKAKRSLPKGIKFRVSLTKRRIQILEKANEKVKDVVKVKFAYADLNGNLKLLLQQKLNTGQWTIPFKNEIELDSILQNLKEIPSQNDQHVNQHDSAES